MPKRKRAKGQHGQRTILSDSEDEIIVPLSQRLTKHDSGGDSANEHIQDRLRAGATAVNNGIVTPVTHESSELYSNEETEGNDELLINPTPEISTTATSTRILVPDCRGGPSYPRSLYEGWSRDLDVIKEVKALASLIKAHQDAHMDSNDKPDYTYFSLDHFSIYRPENVAKHGNELVTLDRLSKDRYPEFCFDGLLSFGKHRYFVNNVPFATLTVDGYGDHDITEMNGQLCIQSTHARRQDAWYRLGTPAPEYRRFYQPFLWLARFTKHFVDYLLCTENVTISYFRESFHAWLVEEYGQEEDTSLYTWLREANLIDFRTTVATHVEFLWKECYGTQAPSDDIKICNQPIWTEVHPARLTAIPEQPNRAKRTVVTPFASDCFKTMYFADQFLATPIADMEVRQTVQKLKADLGLTPLYVTPDSALTPVSDALEARLPTPDATAATVTNAVEITVGDVVMLPPEKDGQWKSTEDCWYAYVQRVRTNRNGRTRLDVIWLYHASDTTIGTANFPFQNELFFSDNCGCDTKEHREALPSEEVIGKVDVSWFVRDPCRANETGLFVRQKFRTVPDMGHYDFVTLRNGDFRCHHQPDHMEEVNDAYAIGDTALVRSPTQTLCEIAQIIDRQGRRLRLRRLRRKRESLPSARANQLVFTSEVFEAYCNGNGDSVDEEEEEVCQVVRKCHVREFSREDIINGHLPTPYDRDGAGDFFFIETGISDDADAASPKNENFPSINQGWDPQTATGVRQLTGLGIFCGGGTFDRGLEEGGAVRFRYAVDWAEHALHSYRANLKGPEEVEFFLGSVNDYLANALHGQSVGVARPGSVEVVSAGSPCQGFSNLQLFTASEGSKQNASMVASVISFADLYCPKYIILENVVSMTESRNERKGHNVFSQILAAFVGLGYQVQQFLIDAWSHGSSQQRSRLFIIATAPGLTPPPQPSCSHAHPANMKVRSLGRSSNGLPFGSRKANPDAALPHISPQEAVSDLPSIFDSQPQLCPEFPEHRTATDESGRNRTRMRAVPTFPRGMTLVKARDQGLLSGEPLRFSSNCGNIRRATSSKMYSRVLPHRLFPTVVTKLSVGDGMNGQCMHWDQHRVLTVMETKRAQGYLDHEVLVGSATQQMKIVGNSVDRKAALVLGLSLRESWLKSHELMNAVQHATHDRSVRINDMDSNDGYAGGNEVEMLRNQAENCKIDNRTVKMSLTLSRKEIENVNKVTSTIGRTMKELLRILSEEEEYRTARKSIHGAI